MSGRTNLPSNESLPLQERRGKGGRITKTRKAGVMSFAMSSVSHLLLFFSESPICRHILWTLCSLRKRKRDLHITDGCTGESIELYAKFALLLSNSLLHPFSLNLVSTQTGAGSLFLFQLPPSSPPHHCSLSSFCFPFSSCLFYFFSPQCSIPARKEEDGRWGRNKRMDASSYTLSTCPLAFLGFKLPACGCRQGWWMYG